MKKILLSISILLLSIGLFSQEKLNPPVKNGSKLSYIIFSDGQEIPMMISVDSLASDRIKLAWDIQGMGTGAWIMNGTSLSSATRGWWDQPAAGVDAELANEQTVLIISKAVWAALQSDKRADFDMQTYSIKEPTEQQQLKLNGKQLDVLLLEGQNGTTRIWLLNNPAFPAILKIEGNTMGPDIEIRDIQ